MATVSGSLRLVTDRPALVTEVWVRSSESRPYGSGLLTDFNDVVPVTNGEVSFTAVPGAAVLVLVQPSGPQDFVPIIVGEGAQQTLAEVVQAGRLAQGRSAEDLGAMVRSIQATLASSERMYELMAGLVARSEVAARDARGAESGAKTSESNAAGSASAASSSAEAAREARVGAEAARDVADRASTSASEFAEDAQDAQRAAAASAEAAGVSERAAGESAGSADRSARLAATSAEAAGVSERAAAKSAESAAALEASAMGAQAGAAESAKAAATSEQNAATHASEAAQHEEDAAESAESARGDADRAENAIANTRFDGDRLVVFDKTSPHLTGPAPTISEDGTWVIDGVDTGLRAIGQDGSMRFEDLTQEQRDSLKPDLVWGEIEGKPSLFPPESHRHGWGEIDGKPDTYPTRWGDVQGKPATYPATWDEIDGKPDTYPTTWDEVQDKPDTYPPAGHGHTGDDVTVVVQGGQVSAQDALTNHQQVLDGLAERLDNLPDPTWDNLQGKPSTYPPAAHRHKWGEIDDKPDTYPATWDSVTGKPATYPPAAHRHTDEDITLTGPLAGYHLSELLEDIQGAPVEWVNITGKPNVATKDDLAVLAARVTPVQLVSSLPASPSPNVLYVVGE